MTQRSEQDPSEYVRMTHGHMQREESRLAGARSSNHHRPVVTSPIARALALLSLLFLALSTGCARGPYVLVPEERVAIDRALVESPAGYDLEPYAVGFSGPVAMTFDGDGNMIVAEGGLAGDEPRIFGF